MAASYAEYLGLSFRPDLHILVLRWLRDASLDEIQGGSRAALHMAQQYGTSQWFVDVRRRTAVSAENSAWMADTFFPAAAAALGGPALRISYLIAPARLDAIQLQPAAHEAALIRPRDPSQPYQFHISLDEAEAIRWLISQP